MLLFLVFIKCILSVKTYHDLNKYHITLNSVCHFITKKHYFFIYKFCRDNLRVLIHIAISQETTVKSFLTIFKISSIVLSIQL